MHKKNRSNVSLAGEGKQCKFLISSINPDSVAQKHFRATSDLEVSAVASVTLTFLPHCSSVCVWLIFCPSLQLDCWLWVVAPYLVLD